MNSRFLVSTFFRFASSCLLTVFALKANAQTIGVLSPVRVPEALNTDRGKLPALPIANWSPETFRDFTEIEIGSTPKPWLNVVGNGVFGGHLIGLLSNRHDGREFHLDTRKGAVTESNLRLSAGPIRKTTHGIGYSTFDFGSDPTRPVQVTYFIEPDASDSEIWLIDNRTGTELTLNYGDKALRLHRSISLRVVEDHLEEIPSRLAAEKLAGCKRRWQEYLSNALVQMQVRGVDNPLLLKEFIWDTYQVAGMVHTDTLNFEDGKSVKLRDANMGSGYTFIGLDVHGRDTLQMVPAISKFDPTLAREILLNMACYTDKEGRIAHRRLLSGQPIDRGHSDESYWLVFALTEYLRNTGDLKLFEEKVPFLENRLLSEYVLFKDHDWLQRYDSKTLEPVRFTQEHFPILEHARRALKNVRFGTHGLPLMEDGDWNDALNLMPQGESVMNAGLYAYSLLQMQKLWQRLGKDKVDELLGAGSYQRDLRDFSVSYEKIKTNVNENAWDGQWYLRGFDNQGQAFGSHANSEGKIYLNVQSWLILAGIPNSQRTTSMVASVQKYLIKDDKISMVAPAYTRQDDNIGHITRLPRGSNENGGQWRQCTLWWIHALQKLGRRRQAITLFNELLISNADLNKLGTESYLYNEYVRGPEAADPGSSGQQAHVQQAALVLGDLVELYSEVKIRGTFRKVYDYPEIQSADQLLTITGTGELVPWTPKWVENYPLYRLTLLNAD